ncbi:MAG: TonB-dependent receptor [Alphaproteobacteria bacterium]|nr:TonB-dependent receptor [Alphaproteobacteria bacterium]
MKVQRMRAFGRAALVLFAGSILAFSTDAIAQPATDPAATEPEKKPEETKPVEKVVVTGSRLKKNEFTSSSPIQIITTEEATLEGLADTADILQSSSPAAGSQQINSTFGGFVTAGGQGANTISLRGLGAQRTLVLVNGRRLAPAGSRGQLGSPDLNTLPESMIQRFEIMTDGGSSIYGSDAVAGAINVITRQSYDGLSVSANLNLPEQSGGEQYQLSGVWGTTFDKGNITLAAEYFNRKDLTLGDRDYLNCAQDLVTDATGKSQGGVGSILDIIDPATGQSQCINTFEGVLQRDTGGTFYNVPGTLNGSGLGGLNVPDYVRVGTSWNRLARTNIGGPAGPGLCGLDFHPCSSSELYAVISPAKRTAVEAAWRQSQAALDQNDPRALQTSLLAPTERLSFYAQGNYDISGGIEAYTEMLFNNRKSSQVGFQQLFPTLPIGHTMNPFVAVPGGAVPVILVNNNQEQDINFFRGVWGIRGEFGADLGFLNGWSYDLYAQWSRSDATYGTDFIYDDRVDAALADVPGFCDPSLIIKSAPAPGCPTINWTTASILDGNFSPAQRAFLFGHETGSTIYDQKLINGSITGDAFQLPAGAVGVALGFEAREDEIDDTPGAMARANNYWGQTTADRTAGSDKVFEVFGETSIPLLADTLLAQSVTLDLSGRYTNYDSYGSGTVYKLGLNWEITPEYRIRATSGTSFRAPALFEMFLGNQTGFLDQRSVDPCINWDDSGDPRIVSACGPSGLNLPVNFAGGTSSALIISGGGGVGNLKAETSEAKTLGFIWTPDWINFRAAVDYWNIEVSDQVERFSARNIVFLCLTRSPPLTNGFCSLVNRDPTPGPNFGSIISVNSQYRNLPSELADGIDLRTRFTHEFSFGTMRLDTATTWTLNHEVDEIGDGPNEINGEVYNADVVGNFDLYFDVEDWTWSWHTDFAGRASDQEDQDVGGNVFLYNGTPFDGRYKYHTEFMATHDTSIRYRAADWEIIAGVQNIFDEPPPSISVQGNIRAGNSAAFGGPYDIIGRRGFISVTKEF